MILKDLFLPIGSDVRAVKAAASAKSGIKENKVSTFLILKKSIDARKKDAIREVFSVLISEKEEALPSSGISVPSSVNRHDFKNVPPMSSAMMHESILL